jgi:uncharacterized protein (DUF1501 family)
MDRRIFLKSSGLALVSYGVLPKFLVRAAYAEGDGRAPKKALVVVFQRGACDGLNTVIPYGDPLYRSLRRRSPCPRRGATTRARSITSTATSACNPALEPLLPLGARAASRRCTDRQPRRDALALRRAGLHGERHARQEVDRRRWMNRALLAQPDPKATPFRAVSLTPTLAALAAGQGVRRRPHGPARLRPAQGRRARGHAGLRGDVPGAVDTVLLAPGAILRRRRLPEEANPGQQPPAAGATYPRGPLRRRAGARSRRLLKSDVGVELAFAEIGAGTRHAAEGGSRGPVAQRHRELGGALAAVPQGTWRPHERRRRGHAHRVRPHRARERQTAAPTTVTPASRS